MKRTPMTEYQLSRLAIELTQMAVNAAGVTSEKPVPQAEAVAFVSQTYEAMHARVVAAADRAHGGSVAGSPEQLKADAWLVEPDGPPPAAGADANWPGGR